MIDDKTKKEILDTLEKEGLKLGEEMAVKAVKAAFALMRLLIPKISTGLGTIIGPVTMVIEPQVLKFLDTIDGEDNPEY